MEVLLVYNTNSNNKLADIFACRPSKYCVVAQEKLSGSNSLQLPSNLAQNCSSSGANCWFKCIGAFYKRNWTVTYISYGFEDLKFAMPTASRAIVKYPNTEIKSYTNVALNVTHLMHKHMCLHDVAPLLPLTDRYEYNTHVTSHANVI